MKYRIEETKDLTQAVGKYVVKRAGKVVRYFWEIADAQDYVQTAIADEAHPNF